MTDVDVRTKIMENLYERRKVSSDGIGAVEIATLARELGESTTRVAVICSDLILHKHVDGDGNMMGFVRISDGGVQYYEEVMRMNSGSRRT